MYVCMCVEFSLAIKDNNKIVKVTQKNVEN